MLSEDLMPVSAHGPFYKRTDAMAMPGVKIECQKGKPPAANRYSEEVFSGLWQSFP
jgi:hypothetical protein